jgi:diguanylate cyclase (GGDEF)-like protein/PAS domain S-box-containing protein
MWRLPADVVESKEDQRALAYVLDQLKAPDEFIAKVYDLYEHPEAESFDILEFKDGRVFERYSRPQRIEGRPVGRVWCFRDVTERKRFEEALAKERNLLRMLIDNIPDSIYVKDREGRKTLTNQADLDFMGVNEEGAVLGKTDAEVYPPHLSEKYHQDDQVVLQHGRAVINREEVVEDASGIRRWLLTSKLPVRDSAGQITGLVGIGRDITERKHLESRLLTMAHYDTLTKLPNRTLFFERSNTGISQARRTGVSCAVLFVDLDHFKSVNDTLGHTVGDELLKDTAAKLLECVREMDTIARLGGDEFIIFLNGLEEAQGAQHIAERIREKFNTPRQVSGNDLFITASIGIATFPHDGDNLEELLKNADAAMYAAKDSGRNAFCFFDSRMNQKAVTKMQIERGLRDALAKSEFRLFYQPIVGIKNGKIRGFEALLRWFRSEGGLILPNEFIPVAEDTGLIVPIGEWVLHQACRFNKRIIDAGFGKPIMSVNISVAQLRRRNIIDAIRKALEETGLPPECLEVEVTESILIQSFDAALEVLKGIRDLGVQVSLDDFGTGYSSLSHLQRLPIANLKIDRLFIKEIGQASEESDLTPAIIELAHKLKLMVVAEGVETDVQLERLTRDRCDYFQGFLFCKPIPEDRVFAFLEENRARLTTVSGR